MVLCNLLLNGSSILSIGPDTQGSLLESPPYFFFPFFLPLLPAPPLLWDVGKYRLVLNLIPR